jgi:hypothetical protein
MKMKTSCANLGESFRQNSTGTHCGILGGGENKARDIVIRQDVEDAVTSQHQLMRKASELEQGTRKVNKCRH